MPSPSSAKLLQLFLEAGCLRGEVDFVARQQRRLLTTRAGARACGRLRRGRHRHDLRLVTPITSAGEAFRRRGGQDATDDRLFASAVRHRSLLNRRATRGPAPATAREDPGVQYPSPSAVTCSPHTTRPAGSVGEARAPVPLPSGLDPGRVGPPPALVGHVQRSAVRSTATPARNPASPERVHGSTRAAERAWRVRAAATG